MFSQAGGLIDNKNGQEFFANASLNLSSFDWIMLIQRDDDNEALHRQMIIEHGLGLYGMELPHSRPAKQSV